MKRGKMSRNPLFEDMNTDKDMDMDMDTDIRMDKMSKVDRPTPTPPRGRVMTIHRVLIHSEPKPALKLFLPFLIIGNVIRTPAWRLVDPSRRQGSRGCLMWTKKGGIIDLVLGRRITWEVSEVGRGRSMERKRGRVWSEVRLIRLGRRSWRVSGYGRLGDRLVISGLRQGSAVLIPSGRPVLLLTAHAHNHKHDPTSSSYPPSIDSRIDNSAPGSPKWYEKLLGIGQGEYPIEQQIENKRRGLGRQRWPYACWVLTLGEL
jgi:hypothetical protein